MLIDDFIEPKFFNTKIYDFDKNKRRVNKSSDKLEINIKLSNVKSNIDYTNQSIISKNVQKIFVF